MATVYLATRTARLTALLTGVCEDAGVHDQVAELVKDVLAIADDRQLLSIGQFARLIDRNKTTLINWYTRGQHQLPAPVGATDNGKVYDGEQCRAWARNNVALLGPDHEVPL